MHHQLEIIMPPTDNLEKAIESIMKPFDESSGDEDTSHPFWDFYVIGGRFSGAKIEANFDKKKVDAFYDEIRKMKITVSGLQCGKQKLQPESQIPAVDELWRKHFPDGGDVCPLFSHFNNQYTDSKGYPDVMSLKDFPRGLTAAHVIIADSKHEVTYMIQESMWNGVSYVDTKWDGKVKSALDQFAEKFKNNNPDYIAKIKPQDDWLVVTVDYHS